MDIVSQAAADVVAERKRQIEVEGWTPDHDDAHDLGEMVQASVCYSLSATLDDGDESFPPTAWPWDDAWWKPAEPRRMLVKAAALLIAEIERLDREAARQ